MAPMKVLVAYDGSPNSQAVLDELARRPWPLGTELRVITVDGPLDTYGPGAGTSCYDELVAMARADAADRLDRAVSELRTKMQGVTISASLLVGRPKEEIIAEAQRWGADLIAVGSHGRGAVGSLFLGSVSLWVVLRAPCSVIVVRPASEKGADVAG